MKFEVANLMLWLIAFAVTFLLPETKITHLGPVYAICIIGSTLILRRARDINSREKIK